MDSNRFTGQWKQIKGRLREEWGALTDDDVESISGHQERLVGKLQERYGLAKDEARKQLRKFEDRFL